jgi:hypothetical protein
MGQMGRMGRMGRMPRGAADGGYCGGQYLLRKKAAVRSTSLSLSLLG